MAWATAVISGCHGRSAEERRAASPPPVTAPGSTRIPASDLAAGDVEAPARPLRRCDPEQPAWADVPVSRLLDRAGELFDRNDFVGALACSEEAGRQAPRSVESHHDRAAALLRLGRIEEARDALMLALALDPEDAETLEAAADLYINQLPPSADRSAMGLEHARRGFRRAIGRDRGQAARLGLLEAQALIDLGRPQEALGRLNATIALAPKQLAARYEKGVALFELCRFRESRETFNRIVALSPGHAQALYHLGLIDEREQNSTRAASYFRAAAESEPAAFPPTPEISGVDFAQRVERIVAALPADVRADLEKAHLETSELPSLDDLVAEKPPLSPTILGLFRGLPLDWAGPTDRRPQAGRTSKGRTAPPLAGSSSDVDAKRAGEACATAVPPERTIILYRRNLLRSIRDASELDEAIHKTLLHEVGHLRGEDDGSLRDRGLE
jgi:tetratricopeptide (TPR) repeat protein